PRPGAYRARSKCRLRATAAAPRVLRALPPRPSCSLRSWPTSFYAGCLQQIGQFLARVKQPRLHRILRNTDDLGDFFHRLLVIVDEIDDFPVLRRKLRQALT